MSDKYTPSKPGTPRPQPGRAERETPLRESVKHHNGRVLDSGDHVTRNVAPPPAPPMPPKGKK